MDVQVIFVIEIFPTFTAFKWLLATVNSQVILKVSLKRKVITIIISSYVLVYLTYFKPERFGAKRTTKRTLISVNTLMINQILFPFELFWTESTFEQLFGRVDSIDMRFQFLQGYKFFATFFTR